MFSKVRYTNKTNIGNWPLSDLLPVIVNFSYMCVVFTKEGRKIPAGHSNS